MKLLTFLKKNSFVLLLLLAFIVTDFAVAKWDPMKTSHRFYKNDFDKTLYHHDWVHSGPVFFGNSAVTGAYMEDKSRFPLVEMGLSYGKITDLRDILRQKRYDVEGDLVVGIDVHTMIDSLQTDPTYPWFRRWYRPYVYEYRDYFRDSGTEFVRNAYAGVVEWNRDKLFSYQPRWIDKELYFGRKDDQWLKDKWNDYDKKFGKMQLSDFRDNLNALQWVIGYAKENHLQLKVIWMPWNKAYPEPPYVGPLKAEVNRMLQENQVPSLDLMNRYEPKYFHDLVHLNREEGAPLFTKEVDEWLLSFVKSSKS